MILLKHDTKNDGMIALSEAHIAGERTLARHYTHQGHFVEVDGPAHVVQHDTAELQKLGYRLATPQEQQEHTKAKKKVHTLREHKAEGE